LREDGSSGGAVVHCKGLVGLRIVACVEGG